MEINIYSRFISGLSPLYLLSIRILATVVGSGRNMEINKDYNH